MIKSFCKINVFLIIKKRKKNNKLHKIKSLFYLHENLYDDIFIEKSNFKSIKYIKNGEEIFIENCIIEKTLKFLENKFNINPHYNIIIYKNIPIGSGLGGGSSNSATVAKYILNDNNIKISDFSSFLEIGSDVPFFMTNYKSAIVKGYGEKVKEKKVKNINYEIFLNRNVKSNTSDIYQKFDKIKKINIFNKTLFQLFFLKISKYNFLINDLEKPFFMIHKDLLPLKEELSKDKIIKLTGSGSTFIIWRKKNEK